MYRQTRTLGFASFKTISLPNGGFLDISKAGQAFFGPSLVRRRIAVVAYELELPTSSRIHHVVHVSLLRAYHGDNPQSPQNLKDFIFDEEEIENISSSEATEVLGSVSNNTSFDPYLTLFVLQRKPWRKINHVSLR